MYQKNKIIGLCTILLISFIFSANLFGQMPGEIFARKYGFSGKNDTAFALVEENPSNNGYIMAGRAECLGGQKVLIVRTDVKGRLVSGNSAKISMGGNDEVARSMTKMPGGNGYVVTGYTRSGGLGGSLTYL